MQTDPVLLPGPALLAALRQLRQAIHEEGQATFARWRPHIAKRRFLISGLNLAYYLALRARDLRPIQAALPPWGLSSLGRSEARVLENLDAVIASLGAVLDMPASDLPRHPGPNRFYRGQRILERNVEELFGPANQSRRVRIMVTLPTEAAGDRVLLADLLRRGANCIRINCAHDDAQVWAGMIEATRAAEAETGRRCKILMDLAGPKVRTGAVIVPPEKRRLFQDDLLLLTRDEPEPDKKYPFQAQCLASEVFEQVQVGQSVWVDDGKLGTRIEAATPKKITLRVHYAQAKGFKLREGKGLNFPDTELKIAPLTEKDLADLDFIVTQADAVGYSFVQSAGDVALLQSELAARAGRFPNPIRQRRFAIVAKIETPLAVRNLPEIIVQAAGRQPFGVMIARGDLAVEVGYQRLAEIQEELLWLCEAAHVPVIWATQVLESLVKDGIPTRAEMTDAAMSERAECVMLNKGPHLVDGVSILNDVLTRMETHQLKKTPQFRALRSWQQIDK